MPLTQVRASTQDSAAGTPVATAVNEDAAGDLQAMVQVGNKSTYASTARAGITAADTATTDLSGSGFGASGLIGLGNAQSAAVRATCTMPYLSITGVLVLYDGSGNPLSVSKPIVFCANRTLRISAAGDYVSETAIVDVGRAVQAKFFAQTVQGGSWTVYIGGL